MRICIRDLKIFKKGCPQSTDCPAWRELLITPKNEPNKPKEKVGRCIDEWQYEFQLSALALLEGNQQATESFRNNMSTKNGPKADPAIVSLFNLFKEKLEEQNIILNYKTKKMINDNKQ